MLKKLSVTFAFALAVSSLGSMVLAADPIGTELGMNEKEHTEQVFIRGGEYDLKVKNDSFRSDVEYFIESNGVKVAEGKIQRGSSTTVSKTFKDRGRYTLGLRCVEDRGCKGAMTLTPTEQWDRWIEIGQGQKEHTENVFLRKDNYTVKVDSDGFGFRNKLKYFIADKDGKKIEEGEVGRDTKVITRELNGNYQFGLSCESERGCRGHMTIKGEHDGWGPNQ
ncbi:hypothetical protein [Baia soyae]|uniref:Uncharacterized protein n=1 Tax=Baia soyae TaxID=1544746 RepID=A0A4R2RS10_9BACL|nr:hypothetical protein [Baia soyae]TCP66103.1 hypothetical protein EDD57_12738 [Baia soyae]